ncbi:MAG: hypothetical protein HND44_00620 [Chloroflexi bacterium]|nr:hypothetical protein [Ardenticatenaceae bacterium]MBL1127005.1 hypothetical protein [Chloroflexota bacterium]NOG33064.1 hypothetical protein [Chloroflexota bacterium]
MNVIPRKQEFALCLNNEGHEASLEIGKLYPVIADNTAVQHGYLRLVDESDEDYAYAAHRFYILRLPEKVEETLLLAN